MREAKRTDTLGEQVYVEEEFDDYIDKKCKGMTPSEVLDTFASCRERLLEEWLEKLAEENRAVTWNGKIYWLN